MAVRLCEVDVEPVNGGQPKERVGQRRVCPWSVEEGEEDERRAHDEQTQHGEQTLRGEGPLAAHEGAPRDLLGRYGP